VDGREQHLERYAAIYVALKELLRKHEANGLTIDCAFLPSIEYVPCISAALLIDEGVPYGCEGDTNQLITAAMFMGVSGSAALMGNLFENAIHQDILDDVIVINHDVVPNCLVQENCGIKIRDFHEMGQGATFYAPLKNEEVTIGGMNFDSDIMWLSKGNVIWSQDTTHCRLSVGIKVEDAKRIAKESLGHHQVTVYGEYLESLQLMCHFLIMDLRII
jgi:L-fucose isomerase-like protein